MEDLNKHQLILLTLLVSFVTSIATGIVIISVLSEEPTTITQTINTVVEKTIEKVVPGETKAEVLPAVKTEVKVLKEEDLLTAAVEKNTQSMVRVWGTYSLDPAQFISYGIIVSKDGMIVTDKAGVVEGGKYFAFFPDGKNYLLELVARNDVDKVAFFKIAPEDPAATGTSTPAKKPAAPQFTVASAAKGSSFKLGQTVVAITGIDRDTITRGTLSGLIQKDALISLVDTDLSLSSPGYPIINLSGEVIGIHTYKGGVGQVVPLENLYKHMEEFASTTSRD